MNEHDERGQTAGRQTAQVPPVDPAIWRQAAEALERRDFAGAIPLFDLEGATWVALWRLEWMRRFFPDLSIDWLCEAAALKLRCEALAAQIAAEGWPRDTADIACAQLVEQGVGTGG